MVELGAGCSQPSCSSASKHAPCHCGCGGSGHGVRRIAWAAAYAKQDGGDASTTVTTRVREWVAARFNAETEIEKLTRTQSERRRNVSERTLKRTPRLPLQDGQAQASAEYLRTVSLVLWMAQHDTEREQIDALAAEISSFGTHALDTLAERSSSDRKRARARLKNRLGDHFWCDCLAGLTVALQEVQGLRDKLANSFAETCAELAAIAWREVKASRAASHGGGPTSTVDGPSRSHGDHAAGLGDAVLESLVKMFVKRVVVSLVSWDPGLGGALQKLRVLSLLLCPDPAGHELVWENCWRPLLKMLLQEGLTQELDELAQFIDGGLDQPHTWDVA